MTDRFIDSFNKYILVVSMNSPFSGTCLTVNLRQLFHSTGRPTVCILITEDNMKNPQFADMLNLLTELKTLKIDNVKISLGRLQVRV